MAVTWLEVALTHQALGAVMSPEFTWSPLTYRAVGSPAFSDLGALQTQTLPRQHVTFVTTAGGAQESDQHSLHLRDPCTPTPCWSHP